MASARDIGGLMQILKRLWLNITELGISKHKLEPLEEKKVRLVNQVLAASSASIIFILIFVSVSSYSVGHILNLYVQGGMLLVMLWGFLMNYLGYFDFVKGAVSFIGPVYVVLSSMAMGKEVNYHFYMVLTLMMPFFIFSARQVWQIIIGVTWSSVAFIFIHWWYENYDLKPGWREGEARIIYYLAIGFLSLLVILCIYYLFIGNHRSEQGLQKERKNFEMLLNNILPVDIVKELNSTGEVRPVHYDSVTVLFTDFVGFTKVAEVMQAEELVAELDRCFSYFDSLMERFHLEKLKTIGDSYMCAGGIPIANQTHALDCVMAAFEIQAFMQQVKLVRTEQQLPYWELRIGIHSGPLVAGIIGEKKFAYDVWGDTVNTASRLESSGAVNRVNISNSTRSLVSKFVECESRGKVKAKNKGEIDMYFANNLRPELLNSNGVPNDLFRQRYHQLQARVVTSNLKG